MKKKNSQPGSLADLVNFKYWAGSDETLQQYLLTVFSAMRGGSVEVAQTPGDVSEPEISRLLSYHGDVAVVQIHGPLNNSDNADRNSYFGAVGYPEIRNALIQAAVDPKVGSIVLDINSGGGAVSGVSDAADLIRKIDMEMKPVTAFTDGMMASAAYWLGSSARSIKSGKVAELGSIGVITVHTEYSKMMQEMGISATVMRAGEFKALGHPMEPLSEKAKTQIQGQLDQLYGMFIGHVAARRSMSVQAADESIGQGRVFLGDRAVAVGLSDGLASFDAVVASAQEGIDKRKNVPQSGFRFSTGMPVKNALTPQNLAAIAEGGAAADLAALTPDQLAANEAAAIALATLDAATAGVTITGTAETIVADLVVTPSVASATVVDQSGVVAMLQGQLAESQGKVIDLTMQARAAEDKLAQTEKSVSSFRAITQASVEHLRVALGVSAGSASGLSDEVLLAEHTALRAQFEDKFKAGGVAAVAPNTQANRGDVQAVDPTRAARLKASRLSK